MKMDDRLFWWRGSCDPTLLPLALRLGAQPALVPESPLCCCAAPPAGLVSWALPSFLLPPGPVRQGEPEKGVGDQKAVLAAG